MGVKFNEFHSKETYGMDLLTYSISKPKAKRKTIDIPLRDGVIDLTNVISDTVKYENRDIKIMFEVRAQKYLHAGILEKLRFDLHGKTMKIVFDDDVSFYYKGFVEVGEIKCNGSTGSLEITVDAEPFKYDILSSAVDWEWDIFDFESGIINETGELVVNSERTISLICRQKRMFPTFIASSDMTVTFDGETFNLPAGSHKMYDIFLVEGINELTFKGNGTVSIDYIGGSL